mmetsp:Transcript_45633/g.152224  ORF Transcript_45633/g.152224 Transcript_45633/m.152224 type:complete len:244 (+) Transcript_45633:100-831(+)
MAASHTSLRQKGARAHLALHTAVRRYNVPQIKALIEEGAELTEVDEFGRTPLHLAVVAASQSHHQPNGDATVREMVSALLAGDVEALCEVLCLHSDAGLTPLHLAARCGNSGLMGLLLDSIDEEVLSEVMEMRTQLTGDLYSGNWGKKDADTGELGELDIEHMTLLHLAPPECYTGSRVAREGQRVLSRVPLGAGAARPQGGRGRRPCPADRRRARRGGRAGQDAPPARGGRERAGPLRRHAA